MLRYPSLRVSFSGLFILFASVVWSQSFDAATDRPDAYRLGLPSKVFDAVEKHLKRDLAALPATNRVYLAKEYTERADSLRSELQSGHFLTDTIWNDWFGSILAEIIRSNPGISEDDITLLVSNYETPNARSIGEGTLIFNVSMLPFLKNESQVAFILCHELAHYVSHHGNLALHQYVNTLYSPETQQQLKSIAKGKYNRTERALELLRGMVYDGRHHSRFKESEADSLGFVFFSHTHYRIGEAVTVLQSLDSIDQSEWPDIPYATLFNSPDFPFQKSWLGQSTLGGLSTGQSAFESGEFDEDSLKTHPDCPNRILKTQKQLDALGNPMQGNVFLQSPTRFSNLQEWSKYEVLEGLYRGHEYGRALFRTLVLLKDRPQDAYLNAFTVECLYKITQFERAHQLRQVLELPKPEYSDEYNQFLKFINQFRVSDLSRLTYHFYRDRWDKYQSDETYQYAAILACQLAGETEELNTRKESYRSTFPDGRYSNEINNLEKQ